MCGPKPAQRSTGEPWHVGLFPPRAGFIAAYAPTHRLGRNAKDRGTNRAVSGRCGDSTSSGICQALAPANLCRISNFSSCKSTTATRHRKRHIFGQSAAPCQSRTGTCRKDTRKRKTAPRGAPFSQYLSARLTERRRRPPKQTRPDPLSKTARSSSCRCPWRRSAWPWQPRRRTP